MVTAALKKGSTETMILSLLAEEAMHGYEIGRRISERSRGVVEFHVASLYPILYRLEKRGFVKGAWSTKSAGRRRRRYSLTAAGRQELAAQRRSWRAFVEALERVARIRHA